jgi:hypothetical protein
MNGRTMMMRRRRTSRQRRDPSPAQNCGDSKLLLVIALEVVLV